MAEPKGPKESGDSGAMRIDADLVRELAELLTANALTEIEVAEGDRRIRVCRDPAPVIGARWRRHRPPRLLPLPPRNRLKRAKPRKSPVSPSSRRWSELLSCRPNRARRRSSRQAMR